MQYHLPDLSLSLSLANVTWRGGGAFWEGIGRLLTGSCFVLSTERQRRNVWVIRMGPMGKKWNTPLVANVHKAHGSDVSREQMNSASGSFWGYGVFWVNEEVDFVVGRNALTFLLPWRPVDPCAWQFRHRCAHQRPGCLREPLPDARHWHGQSAPCRSWRISHNKISILHQLMTLKKIPLTIHRTKHALFVLLWGCRSSSGWPVSTGIITLEALIGESQENDSLGNWRLENSRVRQEGKIGRKEKFCGKKLRIDRRIKVKWRCLPRFAWNYIEMVKYWALCWCHIHWSLHWRVSKFSHFSALSEKMPQWNPREYQPRDGNSEVFTKIFSELGELPWNFFQISHRWRCIAKEDKWIRSSKEINRHPVFDYFFVYSWFYITFATQHSV